MNVLYKFLSLPHAIVLGLFTSTFFIVLPIICKDWVYSPLFLDDDDKLIAYVKLASHRNDIRYYQAQLYFAELDANEEFGNKQQSSSNDDYVDIVYGILSMNREPKTGPKFNLGYLTQTLAALHKGTLHDNRLGKRKIIVCNVDEEPHKFNEVNHIQDYATVYQRYPDSKHIKNQLPWRSNPGDEDVYDEFEKQKDDIIYCFEKALKFSPQFVLMLEDDTVVNDDFVKHIHHHLQTTIPLLKEKNIIDNDQWAYIKLYYPQKWRGYSNSVGTVAELVGIFLVGGTISVLFLKLTARLCLAIRMRTMQPDNGWYHPTRTTPKTLAVYFCLSGLYAVLVCYFVGRVYVINAFNWLPIYSRLETPSPGCCTQAVLYRAQMLPKLVKFLTEQKCHIDFSHDLAIDQFTKANNYLTFVVEPNLAVHVGMLSSVRAWAKNAAEYIYL